MHLPEESYEKDFPIMMLLQVMGGTFPVGSFHHSYGLESYIQKGKVTDISQLREYLICYLKKNAANFEGPGFLRAWEAGRQKDLKVLTELDEEVTAMRLSSENRMASQKTGKAFLRLTRKLYSDNFYRHYYEYVQKTNGTGNYNIASGCFCGICGIPKRKALLTFLMNTLNSLIQVGIKIIPLGQSQCQQMLTELYPCITEVVDQMLTSPSVELSNFVPVMDILSMEHETLYSRLYMS